MNVFKLFFKTVRNNMGTLAIYMIAFLAISVVQTGSLRSNEEANFQAASLNVGLIDQDQSQASKALTEYLKTRHHVKAMTADREKNYDDLFYRYVDYILTIPEGFEKDLEDGIRPKVFSQTLPSSTSSVFLDSQIDEFLTAVRIRVGAGKSLSDALSGALKITSGLPEAHVLSGDMSAEKASQPVWFYFRYLPYILLNVLILGIGMVMSAMKEEDFQRRILMSPVNVHLFRMQTVMAVLCYAGIVWAVFFAASQILYPGQLKGSDLAFTIFNSLAFTVVSLSLAYLTSALARGSRRARTGIINMISNTVSLAISFFCGVFVPLQFLGKGVRAAAHVLPAYWYIRLNNSLSGQSDEVLTASFAVKCILLQLVFAAAALTAAVLLGKRRR